ncbi:RmlC-like cupin domain-containing protein [Hygrophoropsis aurantiaca]|uniref:RmlC-like cupin domain-containing protein n=1 Tax=Hygrophoropsis aurantiaca TaxID=72124 RepID=A0ACB8ACJ5_9AGAM|nr:RmlC-like cupin domain-containing protein [Hygrophoropsis aurantiaca]
MGTHQKAPASVLSTNEQLSNYLEAHPHLVGDRVTKHFGLPAGQLPFLFKVLSFQKALPMQIHPDKETARRLHAEQSDVYSDPNHKPEMALAISSFKVLCGFRPVADIARYLTCAPELYSLIPGVIVDEFLSVASSSPSTRERAALRNLFSAFLTADVREVETQLEHLVRRYKAGEEMKEERDVKDELNEMYPGDSGVFSVYFLNYLQLEPGQAIYVAAGEPHAYIAGDIIECMANSDNVLEAGFTPKIKDISNFVSAVRYDPAPGQTRMFKPNPFTRSGPHSNGTLVFDPPIDELAVMQVVIKQGQSEQHPGLGGPSIVIVLDGQGLIQWTSEDSRGNMVLERGHTVFIGQGVEVEFLADGADLRLYRAYVEVD